MSRVRSVGAIVLRSLVRGSALGALFFVSILFLYAWSLAVRYGPVLGIHLFLLAVSTFYLFSPLPSYLFVLGLLPGSMHRRARAPLVIWLVLAVINAATLYFIPALYVRTPITALIGYILMTPFIRFALPLLSLGSLIYHWFVTHFDALVVRILAHVVGVVTSVLILSNLYWMHRDNLIIFLNTGSLNL